MSGDFGAYLGIAFLVIASPGPDTALVIRNGLIGGRRGGIFTSAGVVAGQATWTLASSAGLAALLVASEPAFAAVRFVGAAFLVFLGGQALFRAIRGGYLLVLDRAGGVLRRSGVRRAIEGAVGAVLVVFGLRLASEHR